MSTRVIAVVSAANVMVYEQYGVHYNCIPLRTRTFRPRVMIVCARMTEDKSAEQGCEQARGV